MTEPPSPVRVAVLMTCHNRRELTARCLAALREQSGAARLDLFLVDDGSTDGTADAVREGWPEARIISGDGTLFWNGGMRLAWEAAAVAAAYDYYLWLNDDVVLEADAIARLLREAAAGADADGSVIVAGSTRQPGTDMVSYGGQRSLRRGRPLRFVLDSPEHRPIRTQTFSGNIVLVSAAAFSRLGNLSAEFVHIFGDLDYGLRATAMGIPVYTGSGFFGECAGPDGAGSWWDGQLSRPRRLLMRLTEERKIHARDWRTFVRRHSGIGPLRALYSLTPYWRILRSTREPA